MMEQELRQILKESGWNLSKRRRGQKEYFYAQKWLQRDVYISPIAKIDEVTKEQVLEKIAKTL